MKSPGRSALIVGLIAIPVAGMSAVALISSSTVPTRRESLRVGLGAMQASVQVVAPPNSGLEQYPFGEGWGSNGVNPVPGQPRTLDELFPAGTRMLPVLNTAATAETRTGVAAFPALVGQTWDPAFAGRYNLVEGRGARDTGELLATASALERFGVRIGGTVQFAGPNASRMTVVGIMDDRTKPASTQTLFGLPGAFGTSTRILADPRTTAYLPDTRISWKQVGPFNKQGAVVVSRDVFENPPPAAKPDRNGSAMAALIMGAIVVGFALLEVMLLAGAAFLVGARAQERSLATVASVGAPRSTLLSIITSSGLVLGTLSGILGVAIGIGAGTLFMRLTDDGSATRYWGYHLSWPAMIGIALAAIVVGWLGALIPAVRASRIDIVAALRGARRPLRPLKRRPVIGVVLLIAGIAITLGGGALVIAVTFTSNHGAASPIIWVMTGMLIGGPILAQLGLILCSGLLLRLLSRALARVGVSARLASRDAARNPGRSIPALAVVMTTVFVAVFVMTIMSSSETASRNSYQYQAMLGQLTVRLNGWDYRTNAEVPPRTAETVAAVRSSIDALAVRPLSRVPESVFYSPGDPSQRPIDPKSLLPMLTIPAKNQCPSEMTSVNFDKKTGDRGSEAAKAAAADWRCKSPQVLWGDAGHIWVGDEADLALVLAAAPSATARAALANGGAVSLYPEYLEDGRVTVSWWPAKHFDRSKSLDQSAPTRSAKLDAVLEVPAHPLPYGIFISKATADRLGLSVQESIVLATPKAPVTTAQLDDLTAKLGAIAGTPEAGSAVVESGPPQWAGLLAWGLVALSALIAIGAASVAIALARADGRRDQATLAAVGASPAVRRGFGFWQAIVLTGVGSLLGAAIGLVPAIALTLPGSTVMFSAPWLQIIATTTLLPLSIACATWLFAGRQRLQLRRSAIE